MSFVTEDSRDSARRVLSRMLFDVESVVTVLVIIIVSVNEEERRRVTLDITEELNLF